jgi:hypothetical protein
MSEDFELLEAGPDLAVAEVDGDKYLVEGVSYDEENEKYTIRVGDEDTVYTPEDVDSTSCQETISADNIEDSSYEEVVRTALHKAGIGDFDMNQALEDDGEKEEKAAGNLSGLSQFY